MDEVDLPLSVVLGVQGLQVDEDLGERFEFRTPCLYCTPVLFSQILIVYPVLLLLTSVLYWVVAIVFWFSMPLKRAAIEIFSKV